MSFLDVNDLNYLLESVKNEKQNIYKSVRIATNSNHMSYLKRSKFNHKINELNKSVREFKLYTKDNEFIDSFHYPYYPGTSEYALNLTRNKFRAEKHFSKCGFRTTNSKFYYFSESELALNEVFETDDKKKVVIKPLNSSLGRGVFVNVSKNRFLDNWELSKADLKASEVKDEANLKFIVQDFIPGFEARATILHGNLVSILARIPPYVKGDGKSSLAELISEKNNHRKKCKYLNTHPIKITSKIKEFLKSQNKTVDYIADNNEYVLLSSVSNISGGGEIINITNKVSNHVKDFALNVLASIPGINTGGLDIILNSFDDHDPVILEANTYPYISLTKYPTYGQSDSPSKIIFESLVAVHQFGKDNVEKYDIENSDLYIKNYIDFTKRCNKYVNTYMNL